MTSAVKMTYPGAISEAASFAFQNGSIGVIKTSHYLSVKHSITGMIGKKCHKGECTSVLPSKGNLVGIKEMKS